MDVEIMCKEIHILNSYGKKSWLNILRLLLLDFPLIVVVRLSLSGMKEAFWTFCILYLSQ